MIDKNRIAKAVKEILYAIGENPEREGLIGTPDRVAEMYTEIFSGIGADASKEIKIFKEEYYDGLVVVKDIPLYSMCEHHLLPFFGVADVVYYPVKDKILGLSKIARVVDIVSKKPQLQERLTNEIADVIVDISGAQGVLVKIKAEHLCMTMRGIKKFGAQTVTMTHRGIFSTSDKDRQQAIQLLSQ